MLKPKISIAVVTYNCEETIEETIVSIINQDYLNKELIVIDGNSHDDTMVILRRYQSSITHLISEPDHGIYDAMNKALKYATGDFLIFLGSDDHFISYSVLSKVAKYINHRECIYYGNVYRVSRKDLYCHKFNKYKLAVKNICHQAIFYPQKAYKSYNYEQYYKTHADYVNNLKLYKNYSFIYIPEVICYYNEGGASAKDRDVNFMSDRRQLICDSLGFFPYVYSCLYHFLRNKVRR